MKTTYRYFFIFAFTLLLNQYAQAATESNDPQSGAFMMRTAQDEAYAPALLLSTDTDVHITGPIAKVVVKQKFYNQTQHFVEGKYLFPLPENAAINAMTLHVGARIIKGTIKEKEQAQQIYQQALVDGKHAGLVEQERPNLFTTQIANIAPQEIILVEITYIETLTRNGNEFSFRFPMTLTPRYTPRSPIESSQTSEPANSAEPALDTGFKFLNDLPAELANPAHIQVTINDMQNLNAIESSSHSIIQHKIDNQWMINTQDNLVPMDRDFILHWTISSRKSATSHFFHEEIDGSYYGLLMLMPPEISEADATLARDVIFIIDTSGSMGGESIAQAKASLTFAIEHLNARQKFNLIEFNSTHRTLFTQSQSATQEYKQQAMDFVNSLQANGGTEMAPALREALTLPIDHEYLRQVIFITDGAVSNEAELFGIIQQLLGESRLFTIGIGSAPNSFFMKKAADLGRGTQTLINNIQDVNSAMSQLFSQLEKPLMRDISIELPDDIQMEFYPEKIPDLYAGQPLVIAMKLSAIPTNIHVSGKGKAPWNTTIRRDEYATENKNEHTGIASLWARAKIESLSDRLLQEPNMESLKAKIVEIAIAHQLVSQLTSFVAVEEVITRDASAELKQDAVANLMPKGSAQFPATAAGIDSLYLSGMALLMLFACFTLYDSRIALAYRSTHNQ